MKTWDVSVVGEIYVDHVLSGFDSWPEPGEELVTEQYVRELGGGAAITACGLGRLGRSVNLTAVIGIDDAPWFERRLGQFSVPMAGVRLLGGATGVTISVSTRVDRSFFTYRGVNPFLEEQLLGADAVARLAQARHVHFAMPLGRRLAGALMPTLVAAGCTTSLDVGFQPRWLEDPENLATCREVDAFLPNELEATLMSGGNAPHAFFEFARRMRIDSPVLKRGARGAMSAEHGDLVCVSPPAVSASDATGAGDAFDAGYIDALLDGAGVEARVRRACVCGSLSTRAAGALGALPTRSELCAVYEQTYGAKP